MLEQTHDHVGVAVLVVVPRDELDEVVVEHDARGLVEDAGAGIGDQVGGDHLVGGVADDALHVGLARVTDGVADIGIGRAGLEVRGQVDHGHVGGRHAEAHAGHLALERGDHAADGLRRAGGGGNDVVEHAAARAPVAAAAGIDGLLLARRGMDGGHQALLDAELLMHDLGERREAVGGAARVGHHAHIAAVEHMVHAHDEGRGRLVLGGRGDDDLLRAALEVAGRFLGVVVRAGGFDDVLRAAALPGDHGGVRLAEHADPVAVDDEVLILTLHRAGELTEHGIVLDHIDHVIHIRLAEIDAADVKRLRTLHHDAQDDTSDSAEAVDADFDRHS